MATDASREGKAMRESVADVMADSRIVISVLHGNYSEFSDELRQLIDLAPLGLESPVSAAILAAYRAARSNGGNISAHLEGEHAAFLDIYQRSPEVEPLSAIARDVRRALARAIEQYLTEKICAVKEWPSDALKVLQSLKSDRTVAASSLPPVSDAAEFMAQEFSKPAELVSGLLHQGSKLVLGGGSKSFKTWTLLDLALSVAYGKPWLSNETRPGRVLYINFEIQSWSWQSRVRSVAAAKGITLEPGRLSFWNLRGKAADFNTLLPKIRDEVKQDFALVILDPIYKLYGGFTDENKAGDVAALLNGIEDVAVSTGAAVAFGAHFSKGNQAGKESIDRISGSGVFARDPDSLLVFTRHETEDAFTVEATLRNFPPLEPFVVRWEHPLMVPDDSLDPSKLKQSPGRKPDHLPEDLLRLLNPSGLLAKDWIDAADSDGISRRTFFRLKKALEQADKIIQERVTQLWKPIKTA